MPNLQKKNGVRPSVRLSVCLSVCLSVRAITWVIRNLFHEIFFSLKDNQKVEAKFEDELYRSKTPEVMAEKVIFSVIFSKARETFLD